MAMFLMATGKPDGVLPGVRRPAPAGRIAKRLLRPLAQQEFHALLRERAEAGGSVLLSSHVLSEVERVADRVAIIRSQAAAAGEHGRAAGEGPAHRLGPP
jgi:hypothetical protein